MGRGYIVDDAVKEYLSEVCEQHAGPITGLLIGQVLLSTKFPPAALSFWLFEPRLILQVSTYICQNMSSDSPFYLNDNSVQADLDQFHIKL